jgi:hypothetical protein
MTSLRDHTYPDLEILGLAETQARDLARLFADLASVGIDEFRVPITGPFPLDSDDQKPEAPTD